MRGLATQAKTLDQRLVARVFLALNVVEQAATLAHHDQQTAAGVKVVLVLFHNFSIFVLKFHLAGTVRSC